MHYFSFPKSNPNPPMGLKVLPNPNKIIIKILKILCCLGQNKDELNLPTQHYKS
jgi:hypothetical protein